MGAMHMKTSYWLMSFLQLQARLLKKLINFYSEMLKTKITWHY